ncbi:hypothetical protein H0H92_004549, partial [Tricholoma furcatifolium]
SLYLFGDASRDGKPANLNILRCVLAPSAAASTSMPSQTTNTNQYIRFTDDAAPSPTPKTKSKPAPATTLLWKRKAPTPLAALYCHHIHQIVLTPGDSEVALKLIDVYFEMLKELLGACFNHTTATSLTLFSPLPLLHFSHSAAIHDTCINPPSLPLPRPPSSEVSQTCVCRID